MYFKNKILNIEIEWLFFLTFLTSIFSLKARNYLKGYFLCYLFILFHELAHIFLAAILGKKIQCLKLSLTGACAKFNYDFNYTRNRKECIQNIFIYLIGPISNLVLAFIFKKDIMIFQINLVLAFVNLIPIKPLD